MRSLSEVEFKEWIAAYPRKLERDVFGAAEPPMVTWNDFTRAPYWPDSIVARMKAGSGIYEVIEDINAPVVTKSKPDVAPISDVNGQPVEIGDTVRVHWGWSSDDGDIHEMHTVIKNDVGTPYESWGISGCANHLRSMRFTKVS